MNFTAYVLDVNGIGLDKAVVELVVPDGQSWRGDVVAGVLTVSGKPGPVWGIRIDGRAILAFAVSSRDDSTDLGKLTMLAHGLPCPAFHAPDGLIHGAPAGLVAANLAADATVTTEARSTARATWSTARKAGLSLSDLLGSAARQLAPSVSAKTGLTLASANLTVKGIPTASEDTFGLDFPTAEVAAGGAGLSEVSFNFRPEIGLPAAPAPTPSGPTVPNLVGYTRELAVRKLASLGLIPELAQEVSNDVRHAGRVVRVLPKEGTSVAPRALVRLFIGKYEGS